MYLIIIISPICFHLNRWEIGKCNCSLEENLLNPKTSRGSYLDQELAYPFLSKKILILSRDLVIL
jgi:hypothetical protein